MNNMCTPTHTHTCLYVCRGMYLDVCIYKCDVCRMFAIKGVSQISSLTASHVTLWSVPIGKFTVADFVIPFQGILCCGRSPVCVLQFRAPESVVVFFEWKLLEPRRSQLINDTECQCSVIGIGNYWRHKEGESGQGGVYVVRPVCHESIGRASPGSEREQGLPRRASLFGMTFKELILNTAQICFQFQNTSTSTCSLTCRALFPHTGFLWVRKSWKSAQTL